MNKIDKIECQTIIEAIETQRKFLITEIESAMNQWADITDSNDDSKYFEFPHYDLYLDPGNIKIYKKKDDEYNNEYYRPVILKECSDNMLKDAVSEIQECVIAYKESLRKRIVNIFAISTWE